uniref:DNA repair protein RAD51 homolog 2 n=2 Tax=Solanum tuberosum TaxID=4113 RepID=M1CDR7_SOLTU
MAQEMAGRILVLRPTSLSEFTDSLQKIKVSLFQHGVKLLIIDSMAALLSGEGVQGPQRQHSLGWHISFIKSVAEFSRIPVVVTNQVRSQSRDGTSHYSFQEQSRGESPVAASKLDSHLVAALGIHWAHAVSIRLIFESRSVSTVQCSVLQSSVAPSLQHKKKNIALTTTENRALSHSLQLKNRVEKKRRRTEEEEKKEEEELRT